LNIISEHVISIAGKGGVGAFASEMDGVYGHDNIVVHFHACHIISDGQSSVFSLRNSPENIVVELNSVDVLNVSHQSSIGNKNDIIFESQSVAVDRFRWIFKIVVEEEGRG